MMSEQVFCLLRNGEKACYDITDWGVAKVLISLKVSSWREQGSFLPSVI